MGPEQPPTEDAPKTGLSPGFMRAYLSLPRHRPERAVPLPREGSPLHPTDGGEAAARTELQADFWARVEGLGLSARDAWVLRMLMEGRGALVPRRARERLLARLRVVFADWRP